MKNILGYAFMLAMSTLLLILGVVGLLIEEPVWLAIMLMVIGFFNLFGWIAGALYSLSNSKQKEDSNETLDR